VGNGISMLVAKEATPRKTILRVWKGAMAFNRVALNRETDRFRADPSGIAEVRPGWQPALGEKKNWKKEITGENVNLGGVGKI